MPLISNAALRVHDVPAAGAAWEHIEEFALSYDGYTECGSFERCAEIANNQRHDSLSDLRTCLFFEQRRWRHDGDEPDQEAMNYLQNVVDKIREHILAVDRSN